MAGFVFLEKILIVFLPVSITLIALSYFGLFNFARGIIILDFVTSSFSNVLLKRIKSLDFLFISFIRSYYGSLSRLISVRNRGFLAFNFNLLLWGSFFLIILL